MIMEKGASSSIMRGFEAVHTIFQNPDTSIYKKQEVKRKLYINNNKATSPRKHTKEPEEMPEWPVRDCCTRTQKVGKNLPLSTHGNPISFVKNPNKALLYLL